VFTLVRREDARHFRIMTKKATGRDVPPHPMPVGWRKLQDERLANALQVRLLGG
jgi:hypothetical protein